MVQSSFAHSESVLRYMYCSLGGNGREQRGLSANCEVSRLAVHMPVVQIFENESLMRREHYMRGRREPCYRFFLALDSNVFLSAIDIFILYSSSTVLIVDVSADRVIECGEEITNSYINHCIKSRDSQQLSLVGADDTSAAAAPRHHQLDDLRYLNSKLTKKQRLRELRQYLFICDCPLCESEEVDSDEDSDNSHDMN